MPHSPSISLPLSLFRSLSASRQTDSYPVSLPHDYFTPSIVWPFPPSSLPFLCLLISVCGDIGLAIGLLCAVSSPVNLSSGMNVSLTGGWIQSPLSSLLSPSTWSAITCQHEQGSGCRRQNSSPSPDPQASAGPSLSYRSLLTGLSVLTLRASLVAQWLTPRFQCRRRRFNLCQGTKSQMPQQRVHRPQLKIPHDASKTWHSQINKYLGGKIGIKERRFSKLTS